MNKDAARAWLTAVITEAAARRGGQSGLARALGRSRNTIAAWKSGRNDPSWLDVMTLCELATEKPRSHELDHVASEITRILVGATGESASLAARIASLEAKVASLAAAEPVGVDFGTEMQSIQNALLEQSKQLQGSADMPKRRKRIA